MTTATSIKPVVLGLVAMAFATSLTATSASAADIEVEVTKLRNTTGRVVVCLWNEASAFPDCSANKPFRQAEIPASAPSKTVVIKNVPDGTYAVSVMHDEDGKFPKNFIGIPKFGVGLTPEGWPYPIGKPSFDKNKFPLTSNGKKLVVEVRYL